MCACVCLLIYACVCACACLYMFACVCVFTFIRVCVCVCVCVCVYVRVYTYVRGVCSYNNSSVTHTCLRISNFFATKKKKKIFVEKCQKHGCHFMSQHSNESVPKIVMYKGSTLVEWLKPSTQAREARVQLTQEAKKCFRIFDECHN